MPQRARLVRKAPLIDRIKAYLNPWDFLLYLSEEIGSSDWDGFQKQWGVLAGVFLNLAFIVARANAKPSGSSRGDDVFQDYYERRGSGWLRWLTYFFVHLLTILSTLNAGYTFWRKRHYRFFEQSVDVAPSTPSVRRVRVDSSPISSSPFRHLTNMFAPSTAQSRAHPDSARDVWELAAWNPNPMNLRLFCLFSPGHVLLYWLFLPLQASDPRPSVTVVTTLFIALLLSLQLSLLESSFSRLIKDSALVNRQVLNEYDTKHVHPALNKPVRDAGTQCKSTGTPKTFREVETYTPTTYVNRGFQVNPNSNYSGHYDPDNLSSQPQKSRSVTTPVLQSPVLHGQTGNSTPIRPSTSQSALRQPLFKPTQGTTNDGGSFGIQSHAHSPFVKKQHSQSGLGMRDRGAENLKRPPSPLKRPPSPLKRSSTPLNAQLNNGLHNRYSQLRGDGIRRESGGGRY